MWWVCQHILSVHKAGFMLQSDRWVLLLCVPLQFTPHAVAMHECQYHLTQLLQSVHVRCSSGSEDILPRSPQEAYTPCQNTRYLPPKQASTAA